MFVRHLDRMTLQEPGSSLQFYLNEHFEVLFDKLFDNSNIDPYENSNSSPNKETVSSLKYKNSFHFDVN